jgi:L-alanine-DL-glutamate epimerase-like enolase superfamily enzyme
MDWKARGEAFGFRAVPSAKLAVDELVAPLCVGQDATRIGPLMLGVQKKLEIFGQGGPLMYAISAVELALWDISGNAASAPVCQLPGPEATKGLDLRNDHHGLQISPWLRTGHNGKSV